MPAAIEFGLGYDLKPMRRDAQQAQQINSRLMSNIQRSGASAAKGMAGFSRLFAGGALVAGVAKVGLSVNAAAGNFEDMAGGIGMDVELLQRFQFAAEQAGARGGDLATGLATLNSKLEDARGGNDAAIQQFKDLGISLQDLDGLSSDQALLKIADALKTSQSSAASLAATSDLLGAKIARRLVPSLKDGSEEFLRMGASATVMKTASVKAIGDIETSFNRLKASFQANVANNFADLANWVTGKKPAPAGAGAPGPAGDAEATMMPEVTVSGRPGFWQTDRPQMTMPTAADAMNPMGPFRPGEDKFRGFEGGYFPTDVPSMLGEAGGGLKSVGLTGGGLTGGAHRGYGTSGLGTADKPSRGSKTIDDLYNIMSDTWGKRGN